MAKYPFSVTTKSCRCESLARFAHDPQSPIVFDAKSGEYNFEYTAKDCSGRLRIRHCPFCGGKAPTTLGVQKYENISAAESERLDQLLTHLNTLDEAIGSLGPPDESTPARGQSFRTLTYNNLSKVAVVVLIDSKDGRPHYALIHKLIDRSAEK